MTIEKFNVDVKANRITKFDEQWYQVIDKQNVVHDLKSITMILSRAYPMNPGLIRWFKEVGEKADSIRDARGEEGSNTHRLIELTLRGSEVLFEHEDGTRTCTLAEWEKFMLWCEWYKEAIEKENLKPLFIEQTVYSIEEGIAGTVDLIAETNEGIKIKDWKTGHIGMGEIQAAKYMTLANRMNLFGKIVRADIVQLDSSLNKKGYRITEVENPDLLSSTFDLTNAMFNRAYPNLKPKYKVYPNTVTLQSLNGKE